MGMLVQRGYFACHTGIHTDQQQLAFQAIGRGVKREGSATVYCLDAGGSMGCCCSAHMHHDDRAPAVPLFDPCAHSCPIDGFHCFKRGALKLPTGHQPGSPCCWVVHLPWRQVRWPVTGRVGGLLM